MATISLITRRLKEKTTDLGYDAAEVNNIAEIIKSSLPTIPEGAKDDEIEKIVFAAVDATLPLLQVGQSHSSRSVANAKKQYEEQLKKLTEELDKSKKTPKPDDDVKPDDKGNPDETTPPKWAAGFIETINKLSSEVTSLREKGIKDNRKTRLEATLKDTGAFGAQLLKAFSKMSFKDDSEFDEYLQEVEADKKSYLQEQADKNLSKVSQPFGSNDGSSDKTISDADLDKLVANS